MRDLIAFVNAVGCSYGLAVLQNKFAGRNVANGETVSGRYRCCNADDSTVGEKHLQATFRLFLDDGQIVSRINDDCVIGYRR